MTNKYMYFIANWKMFGDLRTLNSLDSIIKFSKNNKNAKFRIVKKSGLLDLPKPQPLTARFLDSFSA